MRIETLMLVASLLSVVAYDVEGHNGTVNISGTIQDNTCAVAADSKNKTVQLGNVTRSQFSFVGERSPAVPFVINLENCGPAASEATVTFSGTADTVNSDLFAIDKTSDSATGLAVAIYDSSGNIVAPEKPSGGYALKPNEVSVALNFTARYKSVIEEVTPGSADAVTTFVLNYD